MATTASGCKELRPLRANQTQADREAIAIELKDAGGTISGVRTLDKGNVNMVGHLFHIDIEDPLIVSFGRFHAEAVAVDQQTGVGQHRRGHRVSIHFEGTECPGSFHTAKPIDMASQAGPSGKSTLVCNSRLRVR